MRKEYDFSKGKRGAVVASPGKTRITIMLDDDVIEHFREKAEAQGRGYQTMINSALRLAMKEASGEFHEDDQPVTVGVLRDVLRQELNPSRSKQSSSNTSPKRTAAGKPSPAA